MWLEYGRVVLHGIKNIDDHSTIILVIITVGVQVLFVDHYHLDADFVEMGEAFDFNVTDVH